MLTAYCDGACRINNPGLCACAWVLYEDGVEKTHEAHYLGPEFHSNNFSEYMGLVSLLEFLYTFNIKGVTIFSDSQLLVNQVNGRWDIKAYNIRTMATKCCGLLLKGSHVLMHVKGHDLNEGNERADQLCNLCLDEHMEEYYELERKRIT